MADTIVNGKNHNGHIYRKRWKVYTGISTTLFAVSLLLNYCVYSHFQSKKQDIRYAFVLSEEFANNGFSVGTSVIYEIIKEGRPIVNKWFKKKEFNINDILIIGCIESSYRCEAVGSCGEVGLFQILVPEESLRRIKTTKEYDFYDIPLNIEMCCDMLNQKFVWKKNRKDAIIAYNGSVLYWDKYKRIKKIVDAASHRMNYKLKI